MYVLHFASGSRFFESEKKKEEQLDLRIEEQRRQLEKLTPFMIEQGVAEVSGSILYIILYKYFQNIFLL